MYIPSLSGRLDTPKLIVFFTIMVLLGLNAMGVYSTPLTLEECGNNVNVACDP